MSLNTQFCKLLLCVSGASVLPGTFAPHGGYNKGSVLAGGKTNSLCDVVNGMYDGMTNFLMNYTRLP